MKREIDHWPNIKLENEVIKACGLEGDWRLYYVSIGEISKKSFTPYPPGVIKVRLANADTGEKHSQIVNIN